MKRIDIKIPDNLTPQQEVFEIAKKLAKKSLAPVQKQIGAEYEVKDLHTQINITRTPFDKHEQLLTCAVCKNLFSKSVGANLFVNYGGNIRRLIYCSSECRASVYDICGEGRAAFTRKALKPVIKFH